MQVNHIQFYLDDAIVLRDQLVQAFAFDAIASHRSSHTHTEILNSGAIWFLLSSPLTTHSPASEFLRDHPPGVADVAFQVDDLDSILARAAHQGAIVTRPLQGRNGIRWSQVQGWGDVWHTLVERSSHLPTVIPFLTTDGEVLYAPSSQIKLARKAEAGTSASQSCLFTAIDHVVLNVPAGELQQAAQWYSIILDLHPGQQFTIQTEYSALHSLVLKRGEVQLPINEPASSTSQIQEFLDSNRGAGIQHIALQTPDILRTVRQLRSFCVPLITVPDAYYHQLRQHYPLDMNWTAIVAQEILVDWRDDAIPALLLQTFTKPIFPQPTFFFEVIERQAYWHQGHYQSVEGFGERNFRALVAAIEQEQLERQSTQKATN